VGIATGVNPQGRRGVVGFDVILAESEEGWTQFFMDLKGRGLHGVRLVVSDAHGGLKNAVNKIMKSEWQRCKVHFYRNVSAQVSRRSLAEVAEAMKAVFVQRDKNSAKARAAELPRQLQSRFAKAMGIFEAGIDDALSYFHAPAPHRTRISSTNPLERLNKEIRRRTRGAVDFGGWREMLAADPPEGYSQWNGRLLAEALGDVSDDQVWRILRKHKIQLQRRRSWCISTDPEFGPKAADVVGLYLSPPEDAVVLCIDEKPHIQVLERAQGWLRLPNGKALNGFSHCSKRNGASTLFAALEVATGQVQAGHYSRRRRREFLDFMNGVVAAHPGQELHVILDNLNTHKPKQDRWLARHPQVHFHFIPTYSSWLNMVEVWFSILSRQALRNLSCTAVRQLRGAIDRFVKAYTETAAPFEWTKAVVMPSAPKQSYSELCK